MTDLAKAMRRLAIAASMALLPLSLAGCAQDGIEFQGKVFEVVGLAGEGFGKKVEPKTQPRAPLVLPPDNAKLPEPGSGQAPVVADQQWPVDREARKVADADARKRAQEQYCRDGNWKDRSMNKDMGRGQGPEGSCDGNILSWISKGIVGE